MFMDKQVQTRAQPRFHQNHSVLVIIETVPHVLDAFWLLTRERGEAPYTYKRLAPGLSEMKSVSGETFGYFLIPGMVQHPIRLRLTDRSATIDE